MTAANELIRKAVKVDPTRKAAERSARPEPLGPPTSLVLRSRPEPAAETPTRESIVFALADGIAYGIDAAAGAPLWQLSLGLASPFAPRMVPGEAAAIAFDARSDELVRLDARTGASVWRLALGERVADPPLVLGNQLVQVMPSGKLLIISLESGELQATVNLGRPLARTPVSDESGRHLYVLGRQDSLFVLNRDPLGCAAVEYLGHPDGSIPCPPALLGRYLIIPQNDSLSDSHWQVDADRRGRIKGQAGAGGEGLGLDVADAHGRRPDRLGDRRPGGIRGVRRRRLHDQDRRSARWPS